LGPTCNHRVLCLPSDDEGSGGDPGVDFYWEREHGTTEGSARGPYGADYDYVPDDTEVDYDEDADTFDPYNYEEEIEGSGIGFGDDERDVYFEPEDVEEDIIRVETKEKSAVAPEDYEDFPEDKVEVGEEEIIVEEEQPKDNSIDRVTDYTETEDKEDTFVGEPPVTATSEPSSTEMSGNSGMGDGVVIQTKTDAERPVSVFTQPGILAAFIGGAVVGLLCAILLVMFIVYRMRKKDEGSYPLDEPKRMPLTSSYSPNDKEIYA